MIHSMTGFGKAEGQIGNKKITVEIRSLNSKNLDLNLRLPSAFREKEGEFRSWLADRIVRGKADVGIYVDYTGVEKKALINRNLLQAYYNDLKETADLMGIGSEDYLAILMRIPDVMRPEREELDETEWTGVMALAHEAFERFDAYRTEEGEKLRTVFIDAVSNIMKQYALLDGPLEERVGRIRQRLQTNLAEVIASEKLDENRLEQEMVYYIEKLDVSEEKQRLKSNCDYFLSVLKGEKAQGRKLGFISQEIGREINTLGSKANDSEIQKMVVMMKDDLEKIKEQILNVL
jgi:uncharacterized protein (TIGR00255 family)